MKAVVQRLLALFGYRLNRIVDGSHRIAGGEIREFCHRGKTIRLFVADPFEHVQLHHYRGEFYEAEELLLMEKYFPDGGVFLDVGANVGNHTIYVGCFLSPGGIIAVEPSPVTGLLLRVNVCLNGLANTTTVYSCALSDESGVAGLEYASSANLSMASLTPGEADDRVVCRVGDELLKGQAVDFIKVDVEGHELRALRGLRSLVARCRPILFVEVEQRHDVEFFSFLGEFGYRVAESIERYPGKTNYLAMRTGADRSSEQA